MCKDIHKEQNTLQSVQSEEIYKIQTSFALFSHKRKKGSKLREYRRETIRPPNYQRRLKRWLGLSLCLHVHLKQETHKLSLTNLLNRGFELAIKYSKHQSKILGYLKLCGNNLNKFGIWNKNKARVGSTQKNQKTPRGASHNFGE